MVSKWSFIGDTGEDALHIYYSGLPGHRTLCEFYLEDGLEMATCWLLLGILTFIVQVIRTQNYSNQYSEDIWNGGLLGSDTKWLLLWSQGTELFKSVEFYLKEMVLKWQDTLWHGERLHSHCWFIWFLNSGQLDKYLYYREKVYDHATKWFGKYGLYIK